MTLLNNRTILKPGMLAKTMISTYWQSTKYLNFNTLKWHSISTDSTILIVNVEKERIFFLYQDSLFFTHNCYNDEQGNPYWCEPIINQCITSKQDNSAK